jgi:type I restriction-modification system DNA methylase subunit
MALKKSELYSSLWASCDALSGGMDASRGFMKNGPETRLRDQDIHRIVDVFAAMEAKPAFKQGMMQELLTGRMRLL